MVMFFSSYRSLKLSKAPMKQNGIVEGNQALVFFSVFHLFKFVPTPLPKQSMQVFEELQQRVIGMEKAAPRYENKLGCMEWCFNPHKC